MYLFCNTDYCISQGIGEYGRESNKDSDSDSGFELPPLKRTRKIKEEVVIDVDDVGNNSVDTLNGILQEPTYERDGSGQSIKAGNDHDFSLVVLNRNRPWMRREPQKISLLLIR